MMRSIQARFFLFLLLFQFSSVVLLAHNQGRIENHKGDYLAEARGSSGLISDESFFAVMEEEDFLDAPFDFLIAGVVTFNAYSFCNPYLFQQTNRQSCAS